MSRKHGRVHVVRVRKTHVDKQGRQREYVSAYLRRTYRDGDTVRNETVANLSMLPPEAVDAIEATLKGTRLVPAGRGGHDHPVAAARACGRRRGDGAPAGPARAAGAGVPGTRHRDRADHLAGDPARLETVHADLVARHHPGGGSGCGRRVHRRGLCRDGLAGRPAGGDREEARGQTPCPRR